MAQVAELLKVRVSLTGWQGGPGSNTFWLADTSGAPDGDSATLAAQWIADYYNIAGTYLCSDVEWAVDPVVIKYDARTGNALEDYFVSLSDGSGTGVDVETSTNRAASVYLSHRSAEFLDGRKIRGGAYLGPIGSGSITQLGGLDITLVQVLSLFWSTSAPGSGMTHAVWHKPVRDKDGQLVDEGVAFTADGPIPRTSKVAMLRSRRD